MSVVEAQTEDKEQAKARATGRMTVTKLKAMKERGEKIVMLTAYDYSTARLADTAGILFKQREDVSALTRDLAAELLKPEEA